MLCHTWHCGIGGSRNLYVILLPESNAVHVSCFADSTGDFPAKTLKEAAL